ncbi:MAG: hypothetical protein JSS49_21420 [Planctomycetes bacterium]|nr:hypothetical protein [Planctomycetota bacterium]
MRRDSPRALLVVMAGLFHSGIASAAEPLESLFSTIERNEQAQIVRLEPGQP